MKLRAQFLFALGLAFTAMAALSVNVSADAEDGPGGTGAATFFSSHVYLVGATTYPFTIVALFNDGVQAQPSCTQADGMTPIAAGINQTSMYCIAFDGPIYDYIPCPDCELGPTLSRITLSPGGRGVSNEITQALLFADKQLAAGKLNLACAVIDGVAAGLRLPAATRTVGPLAVPLADALTAGPGSVRALSGCLPFKPHPRIFIPHPRGH